MNVGELKQALENVPDDKPVAVSYKSDGLAGATNLLTSASESPRLFWINIELSEKTRAELERQA
jgi:hypothetical protein